MRLILGQFDERALASLRLLKRRKNVLKGENCCRRRNIRMETSGRELINPDRCDTFDMVHMRDRDREEDFQGEGW